MEIKKLPNTDAERIQALRVAYQKALTTPKEDLAFSSEMMKYLKPFMTKLYAEMSGSIDKGENQATSFMLRQVIDELLRDIWDEIEITYSNCDSMFKMKKFAEYGVVPSNMGFTYEYDAQVA